MVRACVALADGNRDGADFSSSRIVETPRRPSSMASIRPHGPPPIMTTAQSPLCRIFCPKRCWNPTQASTGNDLNGQCPLWVKSGQLGHLRAMSALPPKADIRTQPRDVRSIADRAHLFDHLIGAEQD